MKKTFKKATAIVATALSLVAAMSVTASAYGVTGENFYYTNDSGRRINSAAKNSTVYVNGSITYDATLWGWLPAPSSCYFYLETPSGSLNKPTSISGSWSSASFTYVGYSDYAGNSVYRMFKDFSCASKKTKTVSARTTSKSSSSGWYTGSVNTGTGHSSDGGSISDFKTN